MAMQKENNRLNGELIDEKTIITNRLMGEIHSLEDCLTKKREELAKHAEKEEQLTGEIKKIYQQISTKYLMIAMRETNIYEYQRLLAIAGEYSRMSET